jgi:hypothetical protein
MASKLSNIQHAIEAIDAKMRKLEHRRRELEQQAAAIGVSTKRQTSSIEAGPAFTGKTTVSEVQPTVAEQLPASPDFSPAMLELVSRDPTFNRILTPRQELDAKEGFMAWLTDYAHNIKQMGNPPNATQAAAILARPHVERWAKLGIDAKKSILNLWDKV